MYKREILTLRVCTHYLWENITLLIPFVHEERFPP